MFSENEITMQCRQCGGRCEDIEKCPLKTAWQRSREDSIFPSLPISWQLSDQPRCAFTLKGDGLSTEDLITGLSRLNRHL